MASTKAYTLRGYSVKRPNGRYIAVFLRPALIVEGRSRQEVLHKLRQLTEAYVCDAATDNQLSVLMSQRAPLRYYVEYWTGMFRRLLDNSFTSFTETCPIPQHG